MNGIKEKKNILCTSMPVLYIVCIRVAYIYKIICIKRRLVIAVVVIELKIFGKYDDGITVSYITYIEIIINTFKYIYTIGIIPINNNLSINMPGCIWKRERMHSSNYILE